MDQFATESRLSSDVEELKADLLKIKGDLRTLADGLFSQTKEGAKTLKDSTVAQVQSSVATAEDYIQKHPVSALFGSFIVGLLVGKVFSSR